jgi:D-lactate dehydrogenase
MHVVVFDAHSFEKPTLQAACEAAQHPHTLSFVDVGLSMNTVELARGADCISIFVNDTASASVLERLSELGVRYIALRSAGYNHVDMHAAKRLGMRVANVPAYSPYAVAEHTVALMLALNRRLIRAHARIRELNFSLDGLVGFDVHGKTVGIIGTGKIGQLVARIVHGFGCNVLCFDITPNAELVERSNARYVELSTLCRESDIVTLHAPLLPETKYLINADRIAEMKRGVMLINTSRGGLINTRDVIAGLKRGQIGYLGLDVYELEQGLFFHDFSDTVLQDDVIARLLTFPNVLVTSHQAFLTDTALRNIAETTFANIDCWANNTETLNELALR